MIANDFIVDANKLQILYNPSGSKKKYSVQEFYFFLQDFFDEPASMHLKIPIFAESNEVYSLINGWTIDKEGMRHLSGGILKQVEAHQL